MYATGRREMCVYYLCNLCNRKDTENRYMLYGMCTVEYVIRDKQSGARRFRYYSYSKLKN